METKITNGRGLSGSALKLIAIIFMVIDHFGAVVVETGILHGADQVRLQEILVADYGQMWLLIDTILRTAGRIAFPIFCFLLVEGFLHTRDVKRYFINLSVFALLSEVFFDLAIFNVFLEFGYQNVFFTLAIGLLTLIGLKRYEGFCKKALVIIGGCVLAMLMKTDYNFIGILMMVCFYMLRNNRKLQFIAVGAIAFFVSIFYYGAAVLALIPIYFYNGERGRVSFKYAFYIFYPAHLLLLFLIRYAINM